jgi:hypothetical protein
VGNCVNDNFMTEHCQGPIEVRDSIFADSDRYGIVTRHTERLTLRGVHVMHNTQGGLVVSGKREGHSFTDFETGADLHTMNGVNWTLAGLHLHGRAPLFKADGEYPNQGIEGTWEDLPGLVNRGVHFYHETA